MHAKQSMGVWKFLLTSDNILAFLIFKDFAFAPQLFVH